MIIKDNWLPWPQIQQQPRRITVDEKQALVKAAKPLIPSKTVYDINKCGNNGNLIVAILDESGSMAGVRNQTISAFNEFLNGQKLASKEADVGQGYVTLIKFDAPEIKTVYKNLPMSEAPDLNLETYNPRGGTNLNDAIGFAIADVNNSLSMIVEDKRPGVIFVIMTDGEENQSLCFETIEVRNLVRSSENAQWNFTFIGANIDAFSSGAQLGFGLHNTMQFDTSAIGGAMLSVNNSVSRMRMAKTAGLEVAAAYSAGEYTDLERSMATKNNS